MWILYPDRERERERECYSRCRSVIRMIPHTTPHHMRPDQTRPVCIFSSPFLHRESHMGSNVRGVVWGAAMRMWRLSSCMKGRKETKKSRVESHCPSCLYSVRSTKESERVAYVCMYVSVCK